MMVTAKDIRMYLDMVDDDADVWIEYPVRYGLAQPEVIMEHFGDDDQDMIEAMCIGCSNDRKHLYIFHHY
jgi:hypothetical protein